MYANQHAYDNAEPDCTFTMSFWATINGIDVSGFADVSEQTGKVEEVTEVFYHNVDVSPLLTDEQVADLVRQAQEYHDTKE